MTDPNRPEVIRETPEPILIKKMQACENLFDVFELCLDTLQDLGYRELTSLIRKRMADSRHIS